MKKLFLSLCLLSVVAIYGYSQSLSLSNIHGAIVANSTIIQAGTPDSVELTTYLYVKNNGSKTIDVLCKKSQLRMLDSAEVSLCWAGGCYQSGTNISPNAATMAAGQTITDFVGHYQQVSFNHFMVGESVVRWVFYDRGNVNDSVSVTIKYTTYPLGIAESNSRQSTLSNIYPNPASIEAGCSYTLPSGSQGSILIRDMLGATVLTQVLPATTGKTVINTGNLNDGIYFCSLLVDGKISQTKRLIVKH